MLGTAADEKKYFMHNRKRFQFVLGKLEKLVRSKKKIHVLDIGTSPLTFLIKEKYPQVQLTTLDYSESFKEKCKKKGIGFIRKDLNKKMTGLKKDCYDVILFLEVIEHLSADGRYVVSELGKLLKKRGYLFIQTPNKLSLKNIALRIISKKNWDKVTNRPVHGEEFDHFKEYGYRELVNILKDIAGLKLVSYGRPLYFDDPECTLVYRKNKFFFFPFIYFYYLFVYFIPFFRIGMYFKLKKI